MLEARQPLRRCQGIPLRAATLLSIFGGVCAMIILAYAIAYGETGELPQKPFTWAIKAPPQRLVLLFDHQTSLAVSTGEMGATNVRVVHSSLQDSTTGAQITPEHILLCLPDNANCETAINIAPHKTERLLLKVSPAFHHAGTFTGSVSLAVDQKAEMDAFELTVLSTGRSNQFLGATLILVGIAISWIVTVFIRQRVMRAEALMPVSELGDTIRRLLVEVTHAHKRSDNRLPNTVARLQSMLASLAPEQLEAKGLLPHRIPNPFKAPPDLADAYKQFVSNLSIEITTLSIVIRDGIKNVMVKFDERNGGDAVVTALQKLDALAEVVNAGDEAKASVAKIRGELEDALAAGRPSAMAPGGVTAAASLPSLQQLHIQLSRLSLSVWLIWGGLTWLVGIIALVATNYGFGIGLDYFKCFLWGLGVQVAGSQLQQLAPTTASTTFGIAFPKA